MVSLQIQKNKIGGLEIRSKEHVELLGIEIDFKLNFNKYVGKLYKRAAV